VSSAGAGAGTGPTPAGGGGRGSTTNGAERVSIRGGNHSATSSRGAGASGRDSSSHGAVDGAAAEGKLLRSFSEELVEILRLSKSSDWSARMQAVELLKAQIRGSSAPTDRDIAKVMTYYLRQFNEPHKKVFSGVIDTMCDFVVIFKEEISDAWFRDCLVALLLKLGAELTAPTQTKVMHCLELLRSSFLGRLQLMAVFGTVPFPTEIYTRGCRWIPCLLA
jgi:hypothetical protein